MRRVRIFSVLVLGLALGGCDACGNWPWDFADIEMQACRGSPSPKPLPQPPAGLIEPLHLLMR